MHKRALLIAYFPFAFIVTCLVLAAGAVTLVQSGLVDNGTSDATVDGAVVELKGQLNDFTMAVFDSCCIDTGFALNGTTLPVCANFTESETSACILDQGRFDGFEIPDVFCAALSKVNLNGIPLVGELPSGCASALALKQELNDQIKENSKMIGGILLGVSVLMLLLDLFTCVLICSNREDYDEKYRARIQQQQHGAAVSATPQKYV